MTLRGDQYETVEEAQLRLMGTVVFYDGEPVYVTNVTTPRPGDGDKDIMRVYARSLPYNPRTDNQNPDAAEFRKFISSKKFDLAPFKMGYATLGNKALYVTRRATRHTKQGLTGENTLITSLDGAQSRVDFISIIADPEFVAMLKNTYEDFYTVREKLRSGKFESIACCRPCAIDRDTDIDLDFVWYKGEKIGIMVDDDRHVRLSKKHKYLAQELEEHRVPLA